MISIIKNTDNNLEITFKDEDGVAINITGYSILFTLKRECDLRKSDDEALIKKTITEHKDAVNGISELVLSNEDTDISTGYYYWDLRLIKDGVITQTQRGKLEVTQGVTTRKLN